MPVTIKINSVVASSLVHKGSNGNSIATIPDVCKTPSPGGPVPILYPNISQSIALAKGTEVLLNNNICSPEIGRYPGGVVEFANPVEQWRDVGVASGAAVANPVRVRGLNGCSGGLVSARFTSSETGGRSGLVVRVNELCAGGGGVGHSHCQ